MYFLSIQITDDIQQLQYPRLAIIIQYSPTFVDTFLELLVVIVNKNIRIVRIKKLARNT